MAAAEGERWGLRGGDTLFEISAFVLVLRSAETRPGFSELAGNDHSQCTFGSLREKKGGILVHDEILIELEALKERRGNCSAARTMETITLANNSIAPSFENDV